MTANNNKKKKCGGSGSGRNNNTDQDEALARALQQQFRNENKHGPWAFQGAVSSSSGNIGGGSSRHHQRPASSSDLPTRSSSDSGGVLNNSKQQQRSTFTTPKYKKAHSTSSSTPETTASSTPSPNKRGSGTTPRNSPKSSPRRGSPRSSPRGSPRSSQRNSFDMIFLQNNDTSNDEALARRLEQELRDAELASRLASAERASADFNVDNGIPSRGNNAIHILPSNVVRGDGFDENVVNNNRQHRIQRSTSRQSSSTDRGAPNDCRGKTMYYSLRILLSILAAGITFIVYITVFGSRTSEALDPATWLPGYPEMDPSLGSVGEHNKWKPMDGEQDRAGLTLTVLNNLQYGSDWNDFFQTSMSEWDNGLPDAVTLNIRKLEHDPDCRAVRRAMKVCNANYGPTDWRGVNQILLQDEYIITSLAKMNDYYLEGTNKAQKQYTMCHELGHGLGLGHSDENFHNKDLGNCMDYTERPQNNMHPDESNFRTLEELYGNVNRGNNNLRVERSGTRRILDAEEEERLVQDEFEKYAAYLLDPIEISSKSTDITGRGGWRLLRKTDIAEHYERRLGDGYSIHTSILRA